MSLVGKTIVVTGASSGLGRETAIVLSRLGAKLALVARNGERLKDTLELLEGTNHAFFPFDLENLDAIPKFFKTLSGTLGTLSGVFHAAGVVSTLSVKVINEKTILHNFKAGAFASLMIARAFSQKGVYRQEESTSLAFMSSAAGITGTRGLSVYASSKAAVDGAVRALAVELAKKKVRVNSIAAGMVQTEMHDNVAENVTPERLLDRQNEHPLGFGDPSDVALTAAFLLSDASKWITGSTMVVDGGFSISK